MAENKKKSLKKTTKASKTSKKKKLAKIVTTTSKSSNKKSAKKQKVNRPSKKLKSAYSLAYAADTPATAVVLVSDTSDVSSLTDAVVTSADHTAAQLDASSASTDPIDNDKVDLSSTARMSVGVSICIAVVVAVALLTKCF
jgi:hypothetical protein